MVIAFHPASGDLAGTTDEFPGKVGHGFATRGFAEFSVPRWPEQIPPIPGDVDKDGEAAVRLVSGIGHERDTVVEHPLPGCFEIVDTEEQAHATCKLVADDVTLSLAVGLGEEKSGFRSGWFHDDPSLRAAVIRRGR